MEREGGRKKKKKRNLTTRGLVSIVVGERERELGFTYIGFSLLNGSKLSQLLKFV